MPFSVRNLHRVAALVVAVAITALLQGTMLAGFDQMAGEPQCVVLASNTP